MASRPHWGWQKPPAVSRPLPLQPRQFNVSFYRTPPRGFESLNNMLLLAEERLNLFRILQKLGSEQPHLENVSLGVLLDTGENSEIKEARYKDNASHWILRIAYAQRPELHQLFVKLERLWFDLKWQRLSDEDKSEFLNEEVDLPLVSLPDSPQERLYKIKWTQAPGMVATREFRLKDGFLFFPKSARINYVTEWFQQYLNEALTHARNYLPFKNSDPLRILLSELKLVESHYNFGSYQLDAEEIDQEAVRNFPLCMRTLHETLRETHHLKHFCRMQYGLFLKAVGLTLEETLEFWSDEFTKIMTLDRFQSKYSYLFRHQYGTVGGRIDYNPYSCETIQKQNVGADQLHGCPFKHWDENKLKTKLEEYGATSQVVETVVRFKDKKLYGEACRECFDFFNKTHSKEIVKHPNEYFEESCRISRYRCSSDVDIEDIFEA